MERDLVELLGPVFRDLDGLLLFFLALCNVSLREGVSNNCLKLVWLQGIKHGEEVGAVNLASLWHSVGQVLVEFFMAGEHLKHVGDVDLLEQRHVDGPDLFHLQQLLLVLEYAAKEVLVDVPDGWQVVLHYKTVKSNQI